MGKTHDKLAKILSRSPKKLGLKKDFKEVLHDASFRNKSVFRKKSCDSLFVYKNRGIPVELKRTVSSMDRSDAIADLLNGAFELALEKNLSVPYALFVAYNQTNTNQYFQETLPFAQQIKKMKIPKETPLAWFTKVENTSLYIERITSDELCSFPLLEHLHESKKNSINYKRAQKSFSAFKELYS